MSVGLGCVSVFACDSLTMGCNGKFFFDFDIFMIFACLLDADFRLRASSRFFRATTIVVSGPEASHDFRIEFKTISRGCSNPVTSAGLWRTIKMSELHYSLNCFGINWCNRLQLLLVI